MVSLILQNYRLVLTSTNVLQTVLLSPGDITRVVRNAFYLQVKRRDCIFLFGFPFLQGDLIIAVQPMTVGHLRWRNIFRTFFHSILDEIGQHDNHLALLLPDHSPEVGNGWFYWRLASYVILRRVLGSLKHRRASSINSLSCAAFSNYAQNTIYDYFLDIVKHAKWKYYL